jgi:transcriptional regulator with XRE-family HTH domain
VNDVERLHKDLAERFRGRKVEIDPSGTETGSWFVNVFRDGDLAPVVVEWRPGTGFGLSTPGPDDFGTGVDESYPNAKAAFDRVVQLVLSDGPSVPPEAVRLAGLRQAGGITQAELAGRLGVAQANVSKVENRDDIQVGTLARIVEAMGATLSIQAVYPDGTVTNLAIPANETKATGKGPPSARGLISHRQTRPQILGGGSKGSSRTNTTGVTTIDLGLDLSPGSPPTIETGRGKKSRPEDIGQPVEVRQGKRGPKTTGNSTTKA